MLAAPPAAPDIEIKLPEGVRPDDDLIARFRPLAKELGLDSPKAQKLVDLYAGGMRANAERAEQSWQKQQRTWRDEVKADQELGGQHFDETRVEVGRFFGAFDPDGRIRRDIAALGLANHPSLVRLAVRGARLLREDGGTGRQAPGSGGPTDEDVLRARYPTMFQQ